MWIQTVAGRGQTQTWTDSSSFYVPWPPSNAMLSSCFLWSLERGSGGSGLSLGRGWAIHEKDEYHVAITHSLDVTHSWVLHTHRNVHTHARAPTWSGRSGDQGTSALCSSNFQGLRPSTLSNGKAASCSLLKNCADVCHT